MSSGLSIPISISRVLDKRLSITILCVYFSGYNRRREPLEDSDSISYSPDFFGVQCPPYEDPPPPYTPPKPLPGERPPPYEALEDSNSPATCTNTDVSNRNRQSHNRNQSAGRGVMLGNHGDSTGNNLGGSSDSPRHSMVTRGVNTGLCVTGDHNVMELTQLATADGSGTSGDVSSECSSRGSRGSARNSSCQTNTRGGQDGQRASVQFRNSTNGQPSITMGVQNRQRNFGRNRSSDNSSQSSPSRVCHGRQSENSQALNLELRNAVISWRNNHLHNTTNIQHQGGTGELSSSTTDIGESTTSAESLTSSPGSPGYEPDTPGSCASNHGPSTEEADTTVKRFFDRQFGPVNKGRRYPTTMSQSWTSAQGSAGGPGFKQSISLGAFPPNSEAQSQNVPSARVNNDTGPLLPRSKSEHLKTNGSLINHPFNGVVKSQNFAHPGHGARVAYKEPDEMCHKPEIKPKPTRLTSRQFISSHNPTFRSDVSECGSTNSNVSNLAAAILDPGDIIVTKRQDELRKLRLSHLLNKSVLGCGGDPRLFFSPITAPNLQRSLSDNSVDSSCLSHAEHSDKSANGFTLSNDCKYPANSYSNFLQNCIDSKQKENHSNIPPVTKSSNPCDGQVNATSGRPVENAQTNVKVTRSEVRQPQMPNSMIHSWHVGVTESGDENTQGPYSNTLARNSNVNFEKKSLGEKNVSNMFLPLFKPTNIGTSNDTNKNVPNSEMRALASPMYSNETESDPHRRPGKLVFKRHSMGCFPAKHTDTCCGEHAGHSGFHVKRSDSNRDGTHKKRSSSKDQKSLNRASGPPCCEEQSKLTELRPPYLMHSAIPTDFSLLEHDIPALISMKHAESRPRNDKRRSKSQGRGDQGSYSHRKGPGSGNAGSRGKKKGPQSCSFHQELEQVLGGAEDRSPVKLPAGKHDTSRKNSAISHV